MNYSKIYVNIINSQFKKHIGGDKLWQNVKFAEKHYLIGNQISIARSHVSRRATRTFKPNLRAVKAIVDGQTKKIYVCSKCLRAGKVNRA